DLGRIKDALICEQNLYKIDHLLIITNPETGTARNLADLLRPDLETDLGVGAESMGDRHVRRIAPLSNQHAANSRHVVARVECVPPPANIGLEPAGEIH